MSQEHNPIKSKNSRYFSNDDDDDLISYYLVIFTRCINFTCHEASPILKRFLVKKKKKKSWKKPFDIYPPKT